MEITGRLLYRNTTINIASILFVVLIGLVTVPFTIRGLGPERYGVFSLAWAVSVGCLLFDLGLTRTTTAFVAKASGEGKDHEMPSLVGTALIGHLVLGLLGGMLLFATAGILTQHGLKIPDELAGEARTTFHILAIVVPVNLLVACLRSVLEGVQRFDLSNVVKIPGSALLFVVPALAAPLGFSLPVVVLVWLISGIISGLVYAGFCLKVLPSLRHGLRLNLKLFPALFGFGGWLAISSAGNYASSYLDRFLISSILSVAAVTAYVAPFGIVSQLSIIPNGLLVVLFPALSALSGAHDLDRSYMLVMRSVKYLLLLMGPALAMMLLFADDLLRLWLGEFFREESVTVLRILSVGVVLSSFAALASTLLQSVGRPDIPAKFYLSELLVYVVLLWLLVNAFGIAGAAMAWSIRAVADALLVFRACKALGLISLQSFMEFGLPRTAAFLIGFSLLLAFLGSNVAFAPFRVLAATFCLLAFAAMVWRYLADDTDKRAFLAMGSFFLGERLTRHLAGSLNSRLR